MQDVKLYGKLSGYKTYIVAAIAIAAAVLGFLDGDLTRTQAAPIIVNALIGITLRHGLNTAMATAIEKVLVAAIVALPPSRTVEPAANAPAPTPPAPPVIDAIPANPSAGDVMAAVAKVLADLGHKPVA